ncbi:MAG: class I SAM-dependent methyltransferase [Putridiphycobacter sp.]
MANWFSTWFNTKYYHTLYKHRDFAEAELFITNLVQNLEVPKTAKILDLACGKGRHSIFLNQLGYNVEGCDLSAESIKHAKQFENETLHFFEHDMREEIGGKAYDFVFNLFTSIGYFEDSNDNVKMLQSISAYIKKDGILVIDFMNAHKVINNLVKTETKEIDGLTFNISRALTDGYIVKTISFTDEGKSYEFQERVEALTLQDFEKFFDKTDFSIHQTFGSYNLEPFDVENSDRLIIFAKK